LKKRENSDIATKITLDESEADIFKTLRNKKESKRKMANISRPYHQNDPLFMTSYIIFNFSKAGH